MTRRSSAVKSQKHALERSEGSKFSPIPDSRLPTSHRKAVRFVLAFRLGLGLLLLLSLFLGGCSQSSGLSWQTPKAVGWNILPLVERATEENTELKALDILGHLKLASISLSNEKTLWLIDYNIPAVCGTQGCLYSIYLEEGEALRAVFSGYFQAQLPQKYSLFQVSDRSQFNWP
ncbi:MAG: hypothetical protein ACRDEA_22310, partial [Microcystaceae cyanobacterium]